MREEKVGRGGEGEEEEGGRKWNGEGGREEKGGGGKENRVQLSYTQTLK